MTYALSLTFGELTLYATDINLKKVPGTIKQIIGGKINPKIMPDKDKTQREWSGSISGTFFDTNKDSDRDILQTYFDSLDLHTLTDGIHNGEYYILDLTWNDSKDYPTEHRWTAQICQEV